MSKFLLTTFLLLLTTLSINAQDNDGPNCAITGQVLSAATQNPIPGITVRIESEKYGAITRSDGKFKIPNVPTGIYSIRFSGIGYETFVKSDIIFTCGKPLTMRVELVEKVIELEGAEVKGTYFPKKIQTVTSTQTFNSEDIRRAPGVQEDVIRATALLPGVGVTAAGRNDLLVRGGAPFENLFIVDNIEVPNINHFGSQGASGGPLSLINIDFVRNVEFSSGGFGAKYGDKVSSMTNITLRKGNDQRFAGEVNLSATGAGLILEGPVGDKGTYLFNVRRSYLDFIFDAAGFSFIPQYWDLSTKVSYDLDQNNKFSFVMIGALDDVKLNNDELDDRYDNSRVAVPNQKQYFSGLTWKHLFGNGFATVTLGRSFVYFDTFQNDSLLNRIFQNNSYEGETSLKTDFDFQLMKGMELSFGNQIKFASKLEYDIMIPGYMRLDNNGSPAALQVDTSFNAFKNATYGNISANLGHWKLSGGLRMDYYSFTKDNLFISPRLSAIYKINPVSSIILSAGRYYQAPSYVWLVGGLENELMPIKADQVVLGYEHTPLEEVKVQIETYYKWYSDYPARVYRPQSVLSPAGFDDLNNDIPYGLEPLVSNGTGFSRGVELFIQKKLSDIPIFGLFSLTFSQTRFESLDGIERDGAFDSRFILNLSAGWRFHPLWELSGKFRVATGLPTTPYKDDLSGQLDFANYNDGERLPTFHALDVRLDKRWIFDSFSIITYIDIQNIYNQKNISAIRWNYRTQQAEYNESIGLLPSIGFNFQF